MGNFVLDEEVQEIRNLVRKGVELVGKNDLYDAVLRLLVRVEQDSASLDRLKEDEKKLFLAAANMADNFTLNSIDIGGVGEWLEQRGFEAKPSDEGVPPSETGVRYYGSRGTIFIPHYANEYYTYLMRVAIDEAAEVFGVHNVYILASWQYGYKTNAF